MGLEGKTGTDTCRIAQLIAVRKVLSSSPKRIYSCCSNRGDKYGVEHQGSLHARVICSLFLYHWHCLQDLFIPAIDPSVQILCSNRDDILLEFNLDLLQRGVPAGRFEPFLRPGARSFPRSSSPIWVQEPWTISSRVFYSNFKPSLCNSIYTL